MSWFTVVSFFDDFMISVCAEQAQALRAVHQYCT